MTAAISVIVILWCIEPTFLDVQVNRTLIEVLGFKKQILCTYEFDNQATTDICQFWISQRHFHHSCHDCSDWSLFPVDTTWEVEHGRGVLPGGLETMSTLDIPRSSAGALSSVVWKQWTAGSGKLNQWFSTQYKIIVWRSLLLTWQSCINSSSPSAAYMCQWTGSSLAQVMACHLFSAKPLPEPMLVYCQLDSWEQVSLKFESEFYHFHSRKCIWKYRLSE